MNNLSTNIVTATPNDNLTLESGDNQVLFSSTHSLLGLEVSKLSSVQVSRGTALLEEDGSLSSSVSLDTWETSSGSNVTPDDCLLGTDHVSSSGDVRNRQEPGGGVTVRIVGAGSGGQAGRELGSSQGRGGEGKDKEKHLD